MHPRLFIFLYFPSLEIFGSFTGDLGDKFMSKSGEYALDARNLLRWHTGLIDPVDNIFSKGFRS